MCMGLAAAVAAALMMERIAFRPVRGASGTTLLLTSFAVSAILRVLFRNLISARPIPVAIPASLSGVIAIGPLNLGMIQSISIVVTLALLLGLNLFLHRTMPGRAMRAAAEDFAVLRLMRMRANSVVATAFAIPGLLAGVAGVLWVAQRGSVDPLTGALPVLKVFIATIIGGLGSLSGAVAGASCWASSRFCCRPICRKACRPSATPLPSSWRSRCFCSARRAFWPARRRSSSDHPAGPRRQGA